MHLGAYLAYFSLFRGFRGDRVTSFTAARWDVHAPVAWGQLDWGLACTSARTSPTPFLFFLIGWLGGHGARNGMQLFSVYSISCASVTRITLAPNVFCRGGGIA